MDSPRPPYLSSLLIDVVIVSNKTERRLSAVIPLPNIIRHRYIYLKINKDNEVMMKKTVYHCHESQFLNCVYRFQYQYY